VSGVLNAALGVAAVPVTAACAYLAALSAAARPTAVAPARRAVRFDVIVPAHNESRGIAATVASLRALDYPAAALRVVVVADNCTDDTAARAREAGAVVLERHDAERRGKGYALAHGYEASLAAGFAEAVIVVDADTVVSPNLAAAFAARFAGGADAVQAEYGVRNGEASWRTRLMVIAFTLFHTLRSLGRERLRLSCGLRGNGMGFSASLLRRVPPRAFSIVEDVEYGATLALAGVRVSYVAEATVRGEMPETEQASRSQRERWERGRWALVREHVPGLLRAAVTRRDRVPLDLALDLLVPPLTWLALATGAGAVAAAAAFARGAVGAPVAGAWLAAALCLAAYVVRGCVLSGVGARAILDLAWAPVYALWKITLIIRPTSRRPGEWVRTARSFDP
jgi:GT2 family glycosyltransferase